MGPQLDRLEPQLIQQLCFGPSALLAGDTGAVVELDEPAQVQFVIVNIDQVTGRPGSDPRSGIGTERAAQPQHMILQRGPARRGQAIVPQSLRQYVDRHRLVGAGQQYREQGEWHGRGKPQFAALVPDAHWS
jgi:hypothetical protein